MDTLGIVEFVGSIFSCTALEDMCIIDKLQM